MPSHLTSLSLFALALSTPFSLASSLPPSPDLLVLPLPTTYTTGSSILCLDPSFSISLSPSLSSLSPPADLLSALRRTQQNLFSSRHQHLSVDRGQAFFNSSSNTEAPHCAHRLDSLTVSLTLPTSSSSEPAAIPSIMDHATSSVEDRLYAESYTLSIPLDGPAVLKSNTTLGLFRGLTTFENMFYHFPHPSPASPIQYIADQIPLNDQPQRHGTWYVPNAPYEVTDSAAFAWRAVLLDTSRNFFSIKSILKMLDTMAMVKLNVFHWHVTDSNSWPLELDNMPELSRKGAYSADQVYSENDIRHVVQYAGERGIDVVLEIDTPGHTAIIAESYPEHIACYETAPWTGLAHQPPPGQLRFADPAVAAFTSEIFTQATKMTSSRYFGTGGDEINVKCMMNDGPTVDALNAAGWTLDDALNDFTKRTHATLLEAELTPVVWQEMVLDHGAMPALDKSTIVDIWVNSKDAQAVLEKGYRIVHAAGDYFYLDCGQGLWLGKEKGGISWCDPYKSWAMMYSFDPFANVTEAQKELVLGGQVSLWAEQTDETNFEMVLWPRAAAAAELFWTGPGDEGYPRSSIDALPRMNDIRYRMVDRGVGAIPLQPHWCALRPGVCVTGA